MILYYCSRADVPQEPVSCIAPILTQNSVLFLELRSSGVGFVASSLYFVRCKLYCIIGVAK